MNKDRRIEKIIENSLPAIQSGQETIDSILQMHPKDASAIRPGLEAALWLTKANKSLDPRPGFISSSRHYVEQRVAFLAPRNAWQRLFGRYTPQRWVFNFSAPIILVIILVLVVNSLVLTARLSIPGDPFYSTKLAIEDIQLAFTFNPETKANLYMQFTHERSTEFMELVLNADYQLLPAAADRMETDIIATLHALNNIPKQYQSLEPTKATTLSDSLSNEIFLLRVLRDASPTAARSGIDLAIQVAQSGVMALR
jgi:hypothetical protein